MTTVADRSGLAELAELARLVGVQPSYTGLGGKQVRASADTLRAVLAALGYAAGNAREVGASLAAERAQRREQALEPVVIRDSRGKLSAELRTDEALDASACWVSIAREDGGLETARLSEMVRGARTTDDGQVALSLSLDIVQLPVGYHTIVIDGLDRHVRSMLIVPPRPRRATAGGFGMAAPLYALRGDDDWGVGSFTELARFADLVAEWGGSLTGTLPLFASFFRDPVDPSPYLPVSRRFWNELYVDVGELPELTRSARAQSLMSSPALGTELAALAAAPDVDHAAVMRLKRRVLMACAEALEADDGPRREEFEAFLAGHPELASYADFRAADEREPGWRHWGTAPRELPTGLPSGVARYHRYVQFVAAEQLAAAAGRRAGLYLDLPVGNHPDGYDVWAEPQLFAAAQVGAPADEFFAGGQAWGFPPLHPHRIREDHYRYVIDSYRSAFRHAAAVRIDHVLGLSRLFWIPAGCDPAGGAYVRYRDDELRAIIAIEAYRAGAVVVGEDLGTVAPGIRRAMDRDRMLHTFVYQFAATPDEPLPQPASPSAASVGSHDLPRFASFWRGADITEKVDHGWLDPRDAGIRRTERKALVDAVRSAAAASGANGTPGARPAAGSDDDVNAGLTCCLESLASGPATYLMVDLADLELATVPDNRPGTGPEAGNWRRRLTRPLREIAADRRIGELVARIVTGRERARTKGAAA